ncbi:hypothetical protein [Psychroserpens sp.]|uniref:hypothetical protein n=1 Tax=Psychroserpens sp. TaxID=2020870 RepID=UPI00385EC414
MKNLSKGSQDPVSSKSEIVVSFINNSSSTEEIGDMLTNSKELPEKYNLAKKLLEKRDKIGGFTEIGQLQGIIGKEREVLSLFSPIFENIPFPIDDEKLQHVMWAHGSSVVVQNPKAFSSVSNKRNGTRLTGTMDRISESFIHCPIPTPTYASGSGLSLGSVMVLWRTSLSTTSEGPFVNVLHNEIWEGNQLIATNPPFNLTYLSNGYILAKFFINSRRKINFGLNASFKQEIYEGFGSFEGWAEYASIGAEFVTRNGNIFLPNEM